MDRGKRPGKFLAVRNNKIYMDLKDIIREHTLPFLPAKSLFRFRAVCRDWRLHISTPFFAHNQSLSCRNTSGLFLMSRGDSPTLVSVEENTCGVPDPSLRFLPEPVDIKSSSYGLLCCIGQGQDKAYYVCNPVTQKWKKIPKSSANHGSDPAIVLIFEPSLLNFEAEFKIVCAFPSADFDDAMEFDIYSSKRDSWEVAGEICFAARNVSSKPGVHVNGVVYWLTDRSTLSFDMTNERFKLLQSYDSYGTLGNFDGKLCKVYASGMSVTLSILENAHTNTMQMGSRAKMWSEKKRIVLNSSIMGTDVPRNCSVLHVDSTAVVIQSTAKTYLYDFKSGVTKVVSTGSGHTRCVPYVNNLVEL